MRMLKMRKKTISLIVVLTFLMTLFPLALPAFAADYKRVGSPVSVSDDSIVELNRVRLDFDKGELADGASVIISLPTGFAFCKDGATDPFDSDTEVMVDSDWKVNSANRILMDGSVTGTTVKMLADNEIKYTVTDAVYDDDFSISINLGKIYVDEDFEGDIPLTFDVASKGFDEGSVVVGRVTGGEAKVTVVDDSNFSDKGSVVLRIREDRAGGLDDKDESVKLTLPRGFVWNSAFNNKGVSDTSTDPVWMVDGVYGEVDGWKIKVDEDELTLDVDAKTSTKAAYIELNLEDGIIVDDETSAKYGDVVAKVSGDSDVTPDTIVVGTYGDYEVEVSAADATTVYAGNLEQEIADITFKEAIKGSLVKGRAVTLTLPEWAKWGKLDSSYKDGNKVELKLDSFPGKDGQVAKFVVDKDGSRSEVDFEDMEVALSADAPEGDLEVEISGSAGVKATVKVAQVKKPVAVAVSSSPVIGIGKADQAIGEITITEAEAGLIKEKNDLILELPKDVDWEDFDVEVTAGDLEVGRVKTLADKNLLSVRIDRDSDEVSTIKVTGSVVAYRSVPEGRVNVEVGGTAVIPVNDVSANGAIEDQYGTEDGEGDLLVGTKKAIAEKEWDEGLFADDDYVAKVEVANVGTPAPGDQKITAVFKLGSANFTLNGVEQAMDVAPYAKDGRTYLPMRYVAKALGIKDSGILWKNGTATFISADRVVSVSIGSQVMYINGAAVAIDAAPEIVSGRTMLPIRWIASAFGVDVNWNAATQEITVN